jgi:GTP:adenosylcobinamide-phosphate guanylyltransferase
MNIIIPIGGKGERFLNKGYKETKPLITILDKYMIFYVLDNLKVSQHDHVYIIYNQRLDEYNFNKLILDSI